MDNISSCALCISTKRDGGRLSHSNRKATAPVTKTGVSSYLKLYFCYQLFIRHRKAMEAY